MPSTRPKLQRRSKPDIRASGPDDKAAPTVSNEQCQPIGQVVVAWAKLEAALRHVIWIFLGLADEDGRPLSGRLDPGHKIEMLLPMAERYLDDGPDSVRLFEALDRLEELGADRHFIAHGVWATREADNIPVAMSMRTKMPPGKLLCETFPEERMTEILRGIGECQRIVMETVERLEPWPGKPQ